jgi:hypothetical protein
LATTSLTSGGSSVGIVRSRTQTMEFAIDTTMDPLFYSCSLMWCLLLSIYNSYNGNWILIKTNWNINLKFKIN